MPFFEFSACVGRRPRLLHGVDCCRCEPIEEMQGTKMETVFILDVSGMAKTLCEFVNSTPPRCQLFPILQRYLRCLVYP